MSRSTHENVACPTCGSVFEVDPHDSAARLVCARCRVQLSGPTSGETRFLYGLGRTRDHQRPSQPRPSRGATWGDDLLGAADVQIPDSIGRYAVSEEIGRGGMGVVFRAWDSELERWVALKVLLHGRFADSRRTERFVREARSAARLDHPGIVRVFDIGQFEGQVFFAMAWVSGPNLREILDASGALPPQEAARLVASVARALHHAHGQGLAHRDIKPGNIMVEADGKPLLTDFGLVLDQDSDRITQTGQVMGTPAYMAPEQALGDPDIDAVLADVYSLGTVLFHLLTGQEPFTMEGRGAAQVLVEVTSKQVPPPRSIVPDLPADLDLICQRATARMPAARYGSALALAEDLERFQRGRPIRARPLSVGYRARLFARRNETVLRRTAIAVLLVVLCGLAWEGAGRLREARAWQTREAEAARRLASLTERLARLRAEGHDDEAEAAFTAFTTAEEHRGTAALSDAWLHRAERLATADPDAAVRAWATVYAEPATMGHQIAALEGLVGELARRRDWARVEVAVAHLAELGVARAEHRELALRAAIGRRDVAAAAALWDAVDPALGDARPLLERFAHTTAGATDPGPMDIADIDGDGAAELLIRSETHRSIDVVDGRTLAIRARWTDAVPTFDVSTARVDGRFLVFVGTNDQGVSTRVLEWSGGGLVERQELPAHRVATATLADTDGDGVATTWLGTGPYTRSLYAVTERDGQLDLEPAAPSVNAAGSDVLALLASDLDGDGDDELVASIGAWRAWDVRVLDEVDGRLVTRARRQLGLVRRLAWLHTASGEELVAAVKGWADPPRDPDGPTHPDQRAPGVMLLDPRDGLREVWSRPFSGADHRRGGLATQVFVADLDGDGLDDLAVDHRQRDEAWLLLLRQRPDGTFAVVELDGLGLMGVHDVDGDGIAELFLERDPEGADEMFLVGIGTSPIPATPAYTTRAAPPPPGLPPSQADAWRRAEELVDMGLDAEGARAQEILAARAAGTPLEARALARAAALWTQAREHGQAARVLRALARAPGVDTDAVLEQAVAEATRVGDYDAARLANTELLALPDLEPGRGDRARRRDTWLDRLLKPAELTWRFDAEPPAALHAHHPELVRWDPRRQVLAVDTFGVLGPVATLPLTRTEGDVRLEIDLTVDHIEWGAMWRIELAPRSPEAPGAALAVAGWSGGGGGRLKRAIRAFFDHGWEPVVDSVSRTAGGPTRLSMTLVYLVDRQELVVQARDAEGTLIHHSARTFDSPLPADYALVVHSLTYSGVDAASVSSLRIHHLGVSGFEVGAALPPEAETRTTAALATTSTPGAAPRLRAAWDAEPDARVHVAEALRMRPGELGPLVAGALAPRERFSLLFEAWQTSLLMHLEDDQVRALLVNQTRGLRAWRPSDPAEADVRIRLLELRGQVLWDQGLTERAQADFQAVLEATAARSAPTFDRSRTSARIQLAHIAASTGELDEALAQATAAVAESQAPELIRDALRSIPDLAALADRPGWDEVLSDPGRVDP